MTIIVTKSEIFTEVEKRSSLEGYVSPEQFDKVWANISRGDLLNSYWIEGYTAIIQLLKRYLSSDSVSYSLDAFNEDETLTISVSMPNRYDSKLDGSISTDVKMMIACNILTGWMGVVMPEAASKYEEEAKGYSEDMRVKLLYRKSPDDTLSTAKIDEESFDDAEEALSAPKEDLDTIIESQEALSAPKEDGEALVQGWNYCPQCGDNHI